MSSSEGIFSLIKSEITKWGFVSLISIMSLGSLIDKGAFSSNNQSVFSVIFAIVLTSYLIIIAAMRFIGLKPNKFEMVFIPLVILLMIFVTLQFTDSMPSINDDEAEAVNSDNLDELERTPVVTQEVVTVTNRNQNDYVPPIDKDYNGIPASVIRGFIYIVITIFVILGLVFFARKGDRFIPGIQIRKEIEYSTPLGQYQKDIVQLYIEASSSIESLKGMAPRWYSPTRFSDVINFDPGPPMSNYFQRLTLLYEFARFSTKTITIDDVLEARDLHLQVMTWIDDISVKKTQVVYQ